MAKLTETEERTLEAVRDSLPVMEEYDRGYLEGFTRGLIAQRKKIQENPSGETIAG